MIDPNLVAIAKRVLDKLSREYEVWDGSPRAYHDFRIMPDYASLDYNSIYDVDARQLRAVSALLGPAINDAQTAHSFPAGAVKATVSFSPESSREVKSGIEFTLATGNRSGFNTWKQAVEAELGKQVEQMREGWQVERRGKWNWYLHAASQYSDIHPLKPLLILCEGDSKFHDPLNPRLEHGPTIEKPSDIAVRQDALDEFLKPAGVTLPPPNLEPKSGKSRWWR